MSIHWYGYRVVSLPLEEWFGEVKISDKKKVGVGV